MNNNRICLIGLLLAASLSVNCGGGGGRSGDALDLSVWLPDEFQGMGLSRSTEIGVFKGESLYEYIDGGAELYHSYGFEAVATAMYKMGDSEINIDIYRFDTSDNAFGLYSSLKPPGPGNVSLGVDGFSTENSLDFVKDRYMVHIVSFDRMESTMSAVRDLAGRLESMIPGKTTMPEYFSMFPDDNKTPGSEMIFAESFLGRDFLRDVFSVEYGIDDTLFSLFLTADPGGEKLRAWSNDGNFNREILNFEVKDLPFDNGEILAYEDTYRGIIIAGIKRGMLAGIIGYNESHRDFLSRWLASFEDNS